MATPKRTSASCPYCSWKTCRSYLMPNHIISHHVTEVKITTIMGHCLSCYDRKKNIGFYVCLTCHGGTMSDRNEKQGIEWVTKHSKKIDCKKAHKQLYQELKSHILEILPPPDQHQQIHPTENAIDLLWKRFIVKKEYKAYLKSIEEKCRLEELKYDPDSDYTFTAEDGIMAAMWDGMNSDGTLYKETIDHLNKELSEKNNEHEKEIEKINKEHYDIIAAYNKKILDLQTTLNGERKLCQDCLNTLCVKEKELSLYRNHYPYPNS